jgi:hypothetical protein
VGARPLSSHFLLHGKLTENLFLSAHSASDGRKFRRHVNCLQGHSRRRCNREFSRNKREENPRNCKIIGKFVELGHQLPPSTAIDEQSR